ncbi:MAG: sigma-70 family RNA polymerase sigma factor [Gammaproteobacteria bacterium]
MRELSQTDPSPLETSSAPDEPEARAARAQTVDKLFREHNQALVRFLQIKLRNEAEAREVAQEAYVRLLQLEKTDAISFLRAYLFRIAANLAVDRIHSRQRAPLQSVAPGEALEQIPDPLDIERNVLAQEELELFLTCLDELPPKCRQAFILHRLHKLTTRQVAEQLGISDRMVRKHIARALIYCRYRLDGDTPEAAMDRLSDASRTDP